VAGFFGVVAQSVVWTVNGAIQPVGESCTPSGGSIDIRLFKFVHCFYEVDGGAIFITGINVWTLVSFYSGCFVNCSGECWPGRLRLLPAELGRGARASCCS
jgi:hypothetical protein